MKKILKYIPYLFFGLFIWGWIIRPTMFVETIRDETFIVSPGQSKIFDMNLSTTTKRVLGLHYEVIDGGPIDIVLATMASTQQDSKRIVYVPTFNSIGVTSGNKEALIPAGFWSIIIEPSANVQVATKVKIKTQVHRPRLFQKVTTPNSKELEQR